MNKLFLLFSLIITGNAKKYRTHDGNITYPKGFHIPNITLFKSIPTINTPPRFDWREKANVPIRNQGQCGSCWAFATVSPIEYEYTYKTGSSIHISEQSLVSCNSRSYSCEKGGWWDYDDLIKNGVTLADDYPYDAIDEPCKQVPIFNRLKVVKWGYAGNTIEQIKSAIYQYGPVTSGVAVDDEFYRYIDGIFDHNSKEQVNHAVVLVGWDDGLHSWILRNSWSERWGSNGYMYIEYGSAAIGSNAAYVNIDILPEKKYKYINIFGH